MRENSKRQHPASLHASGEDYLEAILILHMKKGTVRSVDVARHLGVSKPSVCHAVALLKDGCFFTEKLIAAGVDPKVAEADACRIEHIISAESFERLKEAAKGMRQA